MIILAIIAAVIALLLLIPIKCRAYLLYNEELDTAWELKYGFIHLLPREEKERRKKRRGRKKSRKDKPEPEEAEDPESAEAEPEEDSGETEKKGGFDSKQLLKFLYSERGAIKRLLAATLGYTLKRAVKIERLKIRLVLGVDDAMDTALIYGAAAAVIFNAAALLDRHMRLGKHSINVKPAFNAPHIFTEDEAIISTTIFNILAIAAILVWYGLPIALRYRKETKNGKSN